LFGDAKLNRIQFGFDILKQQTSYKRTNLSIFNIFALY